jgi:hypothetical protein
MTSYIHLQVHLADGCPSLPTTTGSFDAIVWEYGGSGHHSDCAGRPVRLGLVTTQRAGLARLLM